MAKKEKQTPEAIAAEEQGKPASEGDEAVASPKGKKEKPAKDKKEKAPKASKEKKPKGKKEKIPKAKTGKAEKGGTAQTAMDLRFTRRSPFLKFFMRIATYFVTSSRGLTIEKVRMKALKPPYLLLCTHQSFIDYAVVERAAHPADVNHICEVSEFVDGESLMRSLGCIPIRRFAPDSRLLYHLKETLVQKRVAAIYPEAHLSFDGKDSTLPDSLYKLIPLLKVPVVVLKVRGTYVSHPCWSRHDNKTPIEAVMTQVLSASDAVSCSEEDIQNRIQSAFHYDDCWWQLQNTVQVTSSHRAEGLEHIFYLCPVCGSENTMHAQGDTVSCGFCAQAWTLTELYNLNPVENSLDNSVIDAMRTLEETAAQKELDKQQLKKAEEDFAAKRRLYDLRCSDYEREMQSRQLLIADAKFTLSPMPEFEPLPEPGPAPEFVVPQQIKVTLPEPEPMPEISRIPHWYDFQRTKLLDQIANGTHNIELPVRVEVLRNLASGFITLGNGILRQTVNGFTLSYPEPGGKTGQLVKNPLSLYSCHVDFDYNGKGPFIDLSTANETFYLYPLTSEVSVTKIAIAAEEIYKLAKTVSQEQKKD